MTSWALTVVFAASGLLYAYRTVMLSTVPGGCVDGVIGAGIHTVTCCVMVAMVWTATPAIVAGVYMGFFAVATGWFVREAFRSTPLRASASWFHAAMMASMVWMAYAMARMAYAMARMAPVPEDHDTAAAAAGMTHGVHSMGVTGVTMMVEVSTWMKMACQALAVAFFLAAAWTAMVVASRNQGTDSGRLPAMHVAAGCLMSMGMGLAFTRMAA